jgi:hypothetical protein
MMAAMFNRVDVVDLLLERGADLNARTADGLTAIDAARVMGAADTPGQLAARIATAVPG